MSEFFTDLEKALAGDLREAFADFQAVLESAKGKGLAATIRPPVARKTADPVYDFQIIGAALAISKTVIL